MEKITKSSDKVLIDPNEPLILPDGTALVGRVEWFLYALCCLDYQNLPTPMSRIEEFANALITGEIPNIQPQSRAEQFFLAILDGNISDLPQPQSRSEVLLDKLARGEFDLSDVEPIQSRYELLLAYLIKNGGIGNIDYVLYEFSEAMKTMYNTVEKPFKSLELSGNTLVNCVLEDTENDDYTSFDEDYSGTSFTINGTSEGAIKSAILKGLTLVNLSENLNTITRSLDWWYLEEKLMDNIEKLKRNTYYTVLYRLENLSGNHEHYIGNEVGIGITAFEKNLPELNIQSELDKNGGWCKIKFQLTDDFIEQYPSYKQLHIRPIRRYTAPVEGESIDCTIRGFAILEGDYITNPIPFNEVFEGMQSVKMSVLTTTGKNLFDKEAFYNDWKSKNDIYVYKEIVDNEEVLKVNNFHYLFRDDKGFRINVKKGALLTMSFKCKKAGTLDTKAVFSVRFSDTAFKDIGRCNSYEWTQVSESFIPTRDYITVCSAYEKDDYFYVKDIQLEYGEQLTTYEPYKSNILTTPEDLELRGIGKVKDELNVATGELTQRIGEIVLNGSEDWTPYHGYVGEGNSSFVATIPSLNNKHDDRVNSMISDKFISSSWVDYADNQKIETVWSNNPNQIGIRVKSEKVSVSDVAGIKAFLSANNIKIKYELATPVVKTVDLNVSDQNNTKIDKIHVFDEVTHVNALSDELTPTVNIGKSVSYPTIIKSNTKYTVDLKRNDKPLTVNLGGTEVTFADGETRKVITTPSTLTNDKLSYYGVGAKCNEIMLIEGEVERNVDYFTGMQSVVMQNQMPILKTVGKNLFNLPLVQGSQTYGTIGGKPTHAIYSNRVTNEPNKYIKVEPNTQITFSVINNDVRFAIAELDKHGNSLGDTGWLDTVSQKTITTKSSTHYIGFNFKKVGNTDITVEEVINSNPMLEYSNTSTSYEPYKTSILSCNEDVALRGIGDMQDTLDCLTGQVTQHIGEIVLDGSDDEGWRKDSGNSNDVSTLFFSKIINAETGIGVCISDIMPSLNGFNPEYGNDGIFIDYASDLDIRISNSKLVSNDVSGFRQWLSQNPITIQYKLKTPVIETVDLNVVDQDGNTIPKIKSYNDVTHLEVTVPKQSLLPHISAEVATDNSKDMSSLTTKHQEISEAQSVIQDNIQSQSDEIDTVLMATTEIFESILE